MLLLQPLQRTDSGVRSSCKDESAQQSTKRNVYGHEAAEEIAVQAYVMGGERKRRVTLGQGN